MKLEDALDRFLTQLQADGRSPHTVAQYRRHVRTLARWCRDVRHSGAIEDVSHEDVARFLASDTARCRADGGAKKPGTGNALRSSIRGFFRYLHRAGHVNQDPTRLVRRARCGTPPPRGLSEEEQRRLLAALAAADGPESRRDHALFHLMLATGIRLGSALALDVEDVDFGRGELEIRTAKGSYPERVILGRDIQRHLKGFLDGRTSGPLFPSRTGRRLSHRHVQRRFSLWLGKAEIKRQASPHSLRHTFALGLYRKTGDILLVKEALRHRSISSTLVYARADEERLRAVMGQCQPA